MPDIHDSSFLQGFRFKGTVRLAPDALVFVNRKLTAPICSMCGGGKSFQNDVASITVDTNVNTPPGSATITIPVPRHGFSRYDYAGRGTLIFKPMQEIEIFMRGRWTVDGEPRYYPVFWGLITQVSQEKGVDSWLIQLQCQDILKWWEMTTLNINPSIIEMQAHGRNPQLFKHDFANFNPYETIMALALIGFGDIVGPRGIGKADNQQFIELLKAETVDYGRAVIQYWQRRFASISRRLKIFGVNGYRLNRDIKDIDVTQFAREFWSQAIGQRSPNSRLPGLFYDQDQFSRFRPDEFIGSGPSLKQSTEKNKLEIAKENSESIGFEFFMDTNGDIIFKPPFWNMDVRDAGSVYRLEEEDIISFSISDNSDLIKTRADVYGRFVQLAEDANDDAIYGYYIDYNLARRYGIRNVQENRGDLRTSRSCYAYAITLLSRENSKAISASATIIGRPEIRLGRPVYVPHEDAFFYVTGISHSFAFGGQFQTTLSLTAARFPHEPVDMFRKNESLNTRSGIVGSRFLDNAGQAPRALSIEQINDRLWADRTTRYPNRVMVFRGLPTDRDIDAGSRPVPSTTSGQSLVTGDPGSDSRPQFNDQYQRFYGDLVERLHDEAFQRGEEYGVSQGLWAEIEDTSKKIFTATHEVIPVSDEGGYEVVGGFPYGRGMTIGALGAIEVRERLAGPTQQDVPGGSPFLPELELSKRASTVSEQYGLESGVSPDFAKAARVRTQNLSTRPQERPDEGWTADELLALKDSVQNMHDVFKASASRGEDENCDCSNDKYSTAVVEQIILAKSRHRDQQLTQPLPETAPPSGPSPAGD